MKKILFVIQSLVHYRLFESYVIELSKLEHVKLQFVLVKSELEKFYNELSAKGTVICLYKKKEKNDIESNLEPKKSLKLTHFIKQNLYFANFLRKTFTYKSVANKVLKKHQPDTIIFSSERYLNFELFLAKKAYKSNIPTVLLGIDYFYVEEFSSYLKSDETRRVSTPMAYIFSFFFKNQNFYVRNQKCLFYPWSIILILYLLRNLPFRPYMPGSSYIKLAFVDSAKTIERYNQLNIDKLQLIASGHMDDPPYIKVEEGKKNINKVIFAVPQIYEHGLAGWDSHIKAIEFTIGVLVNRYQSVVLSLHPKMSLGNYAYLERKYNVSISNDNLSKIIAEADLFVSTYSSTVLWALKLGIPVVIADFFNLKYDNFKDLKNVIKICEFDQFCSFFESITSEKELEMLRHAEEFRQINYGPTKENSFDLFRKHIGV